jgi:drug/metabolite transporter (DMT)-like permease
MMTDRTQKNLRSIRRNLIQIHLAVLFFGVAGIFGKLIALPAALIVLGRVGFASLFLAAAIVYFGHSWLLKNRRDYLAMSGLGVLLALHWWTFFQAIQVSTVAIGLLTYATFPIFVTFLEPYFFSESLKRRDIVVALITFAGVAMVIPEFEIANRVTQGVCWGMLSGLTFALLSILNRRYVQRYSSLTIAFYQDFSAMLLLLPTLKLLQFGMQLRDLALLALLGIVFTGIAHTCFIEGLQRVKARTASIIAALEPVYGVILAALILGEVPSLRVCLGGSVILASTIYVSMVPHR